ncbi:MAG: SDR family oxidoreductase [Tannerella sp.]|jgi:NAD(P)-dependent dehydrogenase (short-subunit alcohol dehydrogenase family)|nr:SDR family oxidoreductase [Tannerella sp.]
MSFIIDFKDKVVLITGVSSGIGMGTAKAFARAGARVAGCSRKPEDDTSITRFKQTVQEEGGQSLYVQADVTKREDLERFVEQTVHTFGQLDVVVSNAGINVFEGAENCSEKMWQYNLDLNLTSHWRLALLCKPYLEQRGEGVILLMTSNHAFSSIPGCFPYNVAKTAITGLVRSLTIEWGPVIRTVGIAPGFIDTAGNDAWFHTHPDAEAERQRTIDLHPMKRIGTTEEVGALCVFLASPSARFISGTTILMDGGRSALMQDEY